MKITLTSLLTGVILGWTGLAVHADVLLSDLDLSSNVKDFTNSGMGIGQAFLVAANPIEISSLDFLQGDVAPQESVSIFSRNTDGTFGSALFADFTLSYNPTDDVETATANSDFTLQANTGYYVVLRNPNQDIQWDYTKSVNYASELGVSLPASGDDSFVLAKNGSGGTSTTYFTLADGPQFIQVNGQALPAAPTPEPSTWALMALAGASLFFVRRRASV
jgi:hypothetical protein